MSSAGIRRAEQERWMAASTDCLVGRCWKMLGTYLVNTLVRRERAHHKEVVSTRGRQNQVDAETHTCTGLLSPCFARQLSTNTPRTCSLGP